MTNNNSIIEFKKYLANGLNQKFLGFERGWNGSVSALGRILLDNFVSTGSDLILLSFGLVESLNRITNPSD